MDIKICKKTLFSGMQPTGLPSIGNYIGAIKNWVKMAEDYDCLFCVADMHSLTVRQEPKDRRDKTRSLFALFLAMGLDPEKSIVYCQSQVSAHAELSWILSCYAYSGELARMTQYKEKSLKHKDNINVGLFTYPVLMAADILLYDAAVVPVGRDQKQHIELTRDLAIRVNNRLGEDTFVVPEGRFLKEGARIMSLDDPTSKMSKSAESEMSRISLLDDDAKIKKAIMRSTTDSDGEIRYDIENKPGVSNLLSIYSAFSGKTIPELEKEYTGQGYGNLKKDLVEVAVDALRPVKERYAEIRNSESLMEALTDGADRANAIAEVTMSRVKDKFGLGSKSSAPKGGTL